MIENTQDIIDSRDVNARIDELKAEWSENAEGQDPDDYALSEDDWRVHLADDDADELIALLALAEDGQQLADWEYGETLIHDAYFVEYAEEMAVDIGVIERDGGWPLQFIDWDRAAEALQQFDYTEVYFDGQLYWGRA